MDDATAETAARKVVERLKASSINFLALDFDLTVLDIHTGGRWSGAPADLATHIRPLFNQLIPQASTSGVHVAVVTFSPQTAMIREVLRTRFGELGERIPIRGEDGTWHYTGSGELRGKQGHMASAVSELRERSPGEEFLKRTTLLVDDDRNNIEVALSSGVKAVWLDPRNPDSVLEGLLQV